MERMIDRIRDIKPAGLGTLKATRSPLVTTEISSTLANVGYREVEEVDIVVKIGFHAATIFPDDPPIKKAETVRMAQKAIADLVYGDVRACLQGLLADVYRVVDLDVRHSMEKTINDALAHTEV